MMLHILIFVAFATRCSITVEVNKLPHTRDYYAGYIKAITDNFEKLFAGERKIRSTSDDEKDILMGELLKKGKERGKIERMTDIKHYDGSTSKLLTEMKRDISSQDFDKIPSSKSDVKAVNETQSIDVNQNNITRATKNLTKTKSQQQLKTNVSTVKTLNLTSKSQSGNKRAGNFVENLDKKDVANTASKEKTGKASLKFSEIPLKSKHKHKSTAHKKRIITQYFEDELNEEDARRNYILEHANMADLPLFRENIKNYQDSRPNLPFPFDFNGQFPYQASDDMFQSQIFPTNGNNRFFADPYSTNIGARMQNYENISPNMQMGGGFNNGYAQQGVRNPGFLPLPPIGNKFAFSPDMQQGFPQRNFMNPNHIYMNSPNNLNFENFGRERENNAEIQQYAGILPPGRNDRDEVNEEIRANQQQEPETVEGETRSNIKVVKQAKKSKRKYKSSKRCGLYGKHQPSMTIERVLMPKCNRDGSCTLVPVKQYACQNTYPLTPGKNVQSFPQTKYIPVFIPVPVDRPMPLPAYNLPNMGRVGNTVCKNCINQPSSARFFIIPLFNNSPCSTDL